jgi:putative hydrolase of HD superfamily
LILLISLGRKKKTIMENQQPESSPLGGATDPACVERTIRLMDILADLKDIPRTGWVENAIPQVESISDHMYRMAVLCMLCPDPNLNRDHLVRMALCHDMAEAVVGDISPAMKVPQEVKYQREHRAISEMGALVPELHGEMLRDMWKEYEAQESDEAKFLRDMDLLEMILQAHKYEGKYGKDLERFFDSGEKIKHPWARAIFDRLRGMRSAGNN